MKDYYPVEVGQVWKDCDKRVDPPRYIVVREVKADGFKDQVAICERCDEHGAALQMEFRATRINVRRMKPGATGYAYTGVKL